MSRSRRLTCLAMVGAALSVPAIADARTADPPEAEAAGTVNLISVSSPPRVAAPGSTFRLTGRVRNTSNRAERMRLTVTLRKTRTARQGRTVRAKRLAAVKGGRTRAYKTTVRLPATLAAGRYHLRACVRIPTKSGNRGTDCRFAKRTILIARAGTPGTPAPAAGPPASAPGAPGSPRISRPESACAAGRAARALPHPRLHGDHGRVRGHRIRRRRGPQGRRPQAPLQRQCGGQLIGIHRQEPRALPRRGLPQHHRGPAHRRPAGRVRDLLPRRRRLPGPRLGDRDRARLAVPDRAARHPRRRAAVPTRTRLKVADRGHVATKNLPEYWPARAWYNFAERPRRQPRAGHGRGEALHSFRAARWAPWADHPVAWCKDYRGGRSFYTSGSTSAIGTETASPTTSPARWSGRPACRQRLQRLRRDGARQLRADQDQRAPEPERAHRLRPAPRRPDHPDRPRRPGPAARPGDVGDRAGHRDDPRLHEQRGRALRPRGRQRLRDQPLGLPVLRAADRHRGAVGRRHPHHHHAGRERPHHGGGPVAPGTPGSATSSCRGSSSSTARPRLRARPRLGAEDPPGRQQPRCLLPRRR